MLAEDKLGVVKESGHQKIEKISTGRSEHLVHPLGRREQKIYTLVADVLYRTASFFTDDFNCLLKDLKMRQGQLA